MSKDEKLKPTDQTEIEKPVVGEAGSRGVKPNALVQPFAPMVEPRAVADIIVNTRNARTHSDRQVQQIAASVRKFGFIIPVVINEKGVLLAGHGRLRAAQRLGFKEVPTIVVKHLTEGLQRAFTLADNRLAELAGWDEELLRVELQELSDLAIDFDFEVTGFDTIDLDRLEAPKPVKAAKPEVVPELERDRPAVSAPGDLWQLGKHLLFCGNALEPASYQKLMSEDRAQMVFTDPPYNVGIDGHVCGLGSVRHQNFAMASGEMTTSEFTEFLGSFMAQAVQYSLNGAIHYICMDWRHIGEVLNAAGELYELKNVCVWNKTNGGMGTFYRSKHEMVFVFKVGSAPHINNFGLGEKGRYRTNVWDYAGVNTFKRGRMDDLRTHPTVKPLPLVVDALKDCSTRGGIVLDPFVGSGTTLLAAEKTGRVGRAIELDPHYVDAAVSRWQALTGQRAVHAETGQAFDEVAATVVRPADAA
ncbi:site-specific DNA-methyltransferase [Reyranella soli]|uniref:site-specific DNA-methyltransferase n=1 Tax=Reyranella soli TaxID=1230389 RepID=UPI001C3F7B96|nr:DNA methyltransferase [Reyranella soli]